MRRALIAIMFLCASQGPTAAATGYAGEFLALGAGARALALGSAVVALADDATASYWNPAGLLHVAARQLHLTHAERYGGMVAHDVLSVAAAGDGRRGLGATLVRVGVADIPFTALPDPSQPPASTNRPIVVSTESSADYALYLGYARRLGAHLDVGLTAKGIYRSIASYSAHGLGADLGLLVHLHPAVTVGMVVRDLTTTPVVWSTDTTDRIRPSLLGGAAVARPLGSGRLTALLAARTGGDAAPADDATPVQVGLEYAYRQVAARAGLEEGRLSVGLGLCPHARLRLDLAYAQHDDLEATQQVSASFRF